MTEEQESLIERLLQKKPGFALSPYGFRNPDGPEAATELRRSYAECDALRQLQETLEWIDQFLAGRSCKLIKTTADTNRAALEAIHNNVRQVLKNARSTLHQSKDSGNVA